MRQQPPEEGSTTSPMIGWWIAQRLKNASCCRPFISAFRQETTTQLFEIICNFVDLLIKLNLLVWTAPKGFIFKKTCCTIDCPAAIKSRWRYAMLLHQKGEFSNAAPFNVVCRNT